MKFLPVDVIREYRMVRQSWGRTPWESWAMALILTMTIILVFPHASPAQSQPALEITFPQDGTVVAPGEMITVVVTPSPGMTFVQVMIIGEGPIGFSEVKTTAPFEFMLTIPMSIGLRSYRISASGAIGPGIGAESPAITLIVEKPGALLELRVEPKLINFEEPGQRMPLRVIGTFSDGTTLGITESTQTTYNSSDPNVATVDNRGIVNAVGPGKTDIIVSYGSQSLSVPVTVPGDPDPIQGTDLIMTSVSGPATGGTGAAITIANTVTNQGTDFSYSVYIGMYLSTDASITSTDTFLGHRYVSNNLLGGESSSDNTTLFIPSNLAPGSYYIGALADSSNYQTEVNENNNGLAGNIISIVPGIDLVMTSVSGPSTSGSGRSITIADTVTNEGLASTFDFYVGLFLSTDTTITTSDIFLTRRYVSGGLAGEASNSANTAVFIPSNLAPGTYYIGAIADESSNQTEGDENNNGLAGNTIIVTPP